MEHQSVKAENLDLQSASTFKVLKYKKMYNIHLFLFNCDMKLSANIN